MRAVSWWITWADLAWPDPDVADRIRRRADQMKENNADTAVIFGAHFRWDFMPLWDGLHDLFNHIATELHARGITLLDHHSSVLTHRYSTREDMLAMRILNRHHVPFAPGREAAAEWRFNGSLLNDWRMIHVRTGQPITLPSYTAEQFCMNHPDFIAGYQRYVRKLFSETQIDGLMSDDALFYPGFAACGCAHCREKFRKDYGRELPDATDLTFWGNWNSDAFKDWVEMRYRTTAEFMSAVKACVPDGRLLMSCCSSSSLASCNQYGLSSAEFLRGGANAVMLEMCGDMPNSEGPLARQLAAQLYHIGLAREAGAPCIGLGYGFYPATADLVWAFNKFLGTMPWISTLKGRLGLPDSAMKDLPDDAEIVATGYSYEAEHPDLFSGVSDARIAIFFSDLSRRYYGGFQDDAAEDYEQCCDFLFQAGFTADVVGQIPDADAYPLLLLPSVACLSEAERRALDAYLADGGRIIANGPFGVFDARGRRSASPYPGQFGLEILLPDLERTAEFPADMWARKTPADCANPARWVQPHPRLSWHPHRMARIGEDVVKRLRSFEPPPGLASLHCPGWLLRRFRGPEDTLLLYGLAANYDIRRNEELEARRLNRKGMSLIQALSPKEQATTLAFSVRGRIRKIECFLPLSDQRMDLAITDGQVCMTVPVDCYYFILRAQV